MSDRDPRQPDEPATTEASNPPAGAWPFGDVPDLLLQVDAAGVVLAAQWPEGFGVARLEAAACVGRPWSEVLPAELVDPCGEDLRAACSGEARERDVVLVDRVFELRLVPAAGARALVMVRDVTRRRGDSQQLRLAAALFENTRDGVLVADVDWKVIAVNAAFSRITGYDRSEVLGRDAKAFVRSGFEEDFHRRLEAILAKQSTWQGEIWNRRKSGEVYPQWLTVMAKRDGAGATTHYVETFSELSERERLEDRLGYLTHYDALTNLPNRALAQDRLERALAWANERGQRVAVMCLDLDRFRVQNDTFGPIVGDKLLREVADRLRKLTGATDTVARFGGDEFLLIEGPLRDTDHARRLALRTLDALAADVEIDGVSHELSASLGISVYPDDATEVLALVQNAMAAVGQARGQGGKDYAFFSSQATAEAQEQHRFEEDLRAALRKQELLLHYQPKLDLRTGRVQGTEALIRWRPGGGEALVRPDRFIPLAEATGLIVPIGEWVLDEACRQTAAWQRAGHPELGVAVNLSPAQLWDPDLPVKVQHALTTSGLAPQHLELEITESLIIEDPARAAEILRDLKGMGVSFAIDDFGTGYSSLSTLRRLPVDTLKVDKSFIDDIPHQGDAIAIVHAVITMGHSLGLRVIAEGVENAEQLSALQQHDCDQLQGFHFSRPLEAAALEAFLEPSRSGAD